MIKRLLDDLKQNKELITALLILWAVLNLVFHRFCPVVLISGFPCPGCGITRAMLLFITLHPVNAFYYNPSYPLWIAIAAVFVWLRYVKGRSTAILKKPLLAICIITIAINIWRLVFIFPGHEPMVYVKDNLFSLISHRYGEAMTSSFTQ